MVNNSITFIGLDTHKKFLEVAFIEDNRDEKPVNLEPINGTKPALQKLVRQFESKHAGSTLHFVYETGHCCYVVAPSLIPKKAGERIKTDKRNALKLALLLRSGDMQPIYGPPSRGIFCVLSVAKQNISHCLGLLYAFI
jgi:transposase